MRIKLASVLALVAACSGDDGNNPRDGGVDSFFIDAPDMAPVITSFTAMPSSVQPGTPTMVTWNWTYAVDPTLPDPTCSIDNGVGAVTRGQQSEITISQVTIFTLSCTNRAGTGAKQVVIAVPPVAPQLATFTATPTPIMPNVATSVSFSWTYSNTPSPPPMCTIDGGVGAVTNGMAVSVTLPQARTFRLTCQNSQGPSTRDVTVSVNECAGNTDDCNANATCNDTIEGFTCTCNAPTYAGNGDTCSRANLNCTTPGTCSANAQCVGGTTCVCNVGYVGDGITCTRVPITFVTNQVGTGDLSTWTGAGVNTGLAAADAVCNSAASANSLPGTYVAWMSDSANDAYCRVHLRAGKKGNNCGLAALPVAAGPWVRMDPTRSPTAPAIDKLLAPTRQTFYPASYTETGAEVTTSTPYVWTGTDDTGQYIANGTCSEWMSASSVVRGAQGDTSGGGSSWTDQATIDPTCNNMGRLRCVEAAALVGATLPSRHPANAKKAFLTSVVGTGVLSTWADALGASSITAADTICQTRARYAGYTNALSFKAWASYSSTGATSRFSYNGPWYRPDGILIASSKSDLTDTRLAAPLYMTETNAYISGNAETGSVWTGTRPNGDYYSFNTSCSSWTSSSSYGIIGRHDLSDYRWVQVGSSAFSPTTASCAATNYRLYCLEDAP